MITCEYVIISPIPAQSTSQDRRNDDLYSLYDGIGSDWWGWGRKKWGLWGGDILSVQVVSTSPAAQLGSQGMQIHRRKEKNAWFLYKITPLTQLLKHHVFMQKGLDLYNNAFELKAVSSLSFSLSLFLLAPFINLFLLAPFISLYLLAFINLLLLAPFISLSDVRMWSQWFTAYISFWLHY